ncbi:MAG: SGNH/GDSL hydrolase family protein [Proteobacteria bacterium]|nr:SGNH/GDSL hydrolase family protein [Pseudomonadota bacterium]
MKAFGLSGIVVAVAALCLSAQGALAGEPGKWIAAWTSPPTDVISTLATRTPPPFFATTLRSSLRLSAGGDAIRIRISNDLGAEPLVIGPVTIMLGDGQAPRELRFSGAPQATIPAGASLVSDPVEASVEPLSRVTVSIYTPGPAAGLTGHVVGQEMVWSAPGDQTAAPHLKSALPGFSRLLLTEVDVHTADPQARTVAIIGDSITEGYLSTLDAYRRWPDRLAERTAAAGGPPIGLANLGISGNRLLKDGDGLAVLNRLDRDLFVLPNVKTLIILIGINDLIYPKFDGSPMPQAEAMIEGYKSVVTRARAKGLKVIAATILPFGKSGDVNFSPEGETRRQGVNQWLRTSTDFDGLVDLDRLCRDPGDAQALKAQCDGGDGLHPSDEGYRLIGDAIPLNLLR